MLKRRMNELEEPSARRRPRAEANPPTHCKPSAPETRPVAASRWPPVAQRSARERGPRGSSTRNCSRASCAAAPARPLSPPSWRGEKRQSSGAARPAATARADERETPRA
eukprot:8451449-Pyramimonas_sp.AAC.1